jgi:hypothetical protein
MEGLSKEELDELALLEKEDKDRRAEEAKSAKRQHLDALRMSKRLSAKHGTPGLDFVVLETRVGNIAVRRPIDVEIDAIDESSDRAALETFAAMVVLEPAGPSFAKLMADHHGVVGAVVSQATKLLRALREEEGKK